MVLIQKEEKRFEATLYKFNYKGFGNITLINYDNISYENIFKPSLVIPIHFTSNYSICKEFSEKNKNLDTKVAQLSSAHKSYNYNK